MSLVAIGIDLPTPSTRPRWTTRGSALPPAVKTACSRPRPTWGASLLRRRWQTRDRGSASEAAVMPGSRWPD